MQSRTRFSTLAWRTLMPSSSRPTCSSTVPFFCADALPPPQADSVASAASPQATSANPTRPPRPGVRGCPPELRFLPTACPLRLLPLAAVGGGGARVVVTDHHEIARPEVAAHRCDRHQTL